MFYVNGTDIKIPCGDSAVIQFTLTADGEPYIFSEGEYALLTVSDRDTGETVIEKTASTQDADGTVDFVFTAADTFIAKGTYCYTVKLMNGGSVDTVQGFPAKSAFTIG